MTVPAGPAFNLQQTQRSDCQQPAIAIYRGLLNHYIPID